VIKVPDFNALYGANPDPWAVSSSFYEQRKLDLVLGVLARPRYAHAWDPACGTGHGAERLADRAEQVLATDAAATAVEITRRTCAGRLNVTVEQRSLPSPVRAGETFDLMVLGEFLYYLVDVDRSATYDLLHAAAAPTAEVVAVHWAAPPPRRLVERSRGASRVGLSSHRPRLAPRGRAGGAELHHAHPAAGSR